MIERDVYREMLEQASADLKGEIAPLVDEILSQRPGSGLNPIGFIYFHILRSWDRDVNHLILAQDQNNDAWHRGGFVEETGFNPSGTGLNGAGTGMGYTDDEVNNSPMRMGVLLRYHDSLLDDTRNYLEGIGNSDEEFDRAIESQLSPFNPFTTRWRMQHLIRHTCKHLGDIQFVKGMLGMPDATYPADD